MNKERMQSLIDLMENLNDIDFNIERWTKPCGTPACVAGWATTIPSWQARGGLTKGEKDHTIHHWPLPFYEGHIQHRAFAAWADISEEDAWIICGLAEGDVQAHFYGTEQTYFEDEDCDDEWENVTPDHVVKALTHYMEMADE